MPLKSAASISAPEAQQLAIHPFDKTTLPDIERAIAQSDLQLSPVTNGNIIRINMPPMSQERRNELVKKLHKKLEEARIQIRNTRKNFHNLFVILKKQKISPKIPQKDFKMSCKT
jgi:ribosome recycling factor